MSLEDSFHRCELPSSCIAFKSSEGKRMFAEALQGGYLEGYFHLAEHFTTQGNTGFCGLGSLAMALNALNIDPKRVWYGVWRWFDETMLDCCEPLDKIEVQGIGLPKVACLAQCNGASVRMVYGSEANLEAFREHIQRACQVPDPSQRFVMVVAYSRETLGQVGVGHFSPVGAYHAESDRVLILDVARFKYPPHWVSVADLFKAMMPLDSETGKSRGYLLLSKAAETDGERSESSEETEGATCCTSDNDDSQSVLSCKLKASEGESVYAMQECVERQRKKMRLERGDKKESS